MRVIQTDDAQELHVLAKQLASSKRVAIICGAGISTAAGIPDFRTAATGLFASLKEKNPDLKISSGKDLFHTNLFQREDTTRAFYQMCAEMKRMANAAPPTDFHLLMKDLDDAGKLFRIYTQNIDSLEAKAGLSFGLGEWQERERLVSRRKGKGKNGKKGMSQKAKGKQRAIEEDSIPHMGTVDESHSMESAPPNHPPKPDHQEDQIRRGHPELEPGPLASTSGSPRLQPVDSVFSTASPSHSLLFGGSGLLNDQQPTLPTLEEDKTSSSPMNISTPVFPIQTIEEFTEMYISPSRANLDLPSTAETAGTVVVPDSQEKAECTMDSSALTNLSSLGDMSLSEILQMPFCSQGSSISDEADGRGNEAILANLPSLALTEEERTKVDEDPSKEVSAEKPLQEDQPVLKQLTIQRFLTVPRVIPLHGTLDEMHCPKCQHVEPLERHLHILESGHSIHCPKCLEQDHSRTALGERSRGVGVLKVSVVLYGEEHKQASRVGEIAEKDLLKAARPDVLIVAGTTLRIPGVKKIVKELSKVIKQPIKEEIRDEQGNPTGEYTEREDPSKRVIFVNRDAPNPEKTWSQIFDTFVQGDAQVFAKLVREEIQAIKNPPPPAIAAAAPVASSVPAIVQPMEKSADLAQNSLNAFWNVSKTSGGAAVMAGKAIAVPLVWEPIRSPTEAIPTVDPMQTVQPAKAKPKQAKLKPPKTAGTSEKASSTLTQKKEKGTKNKKAPTGLPKAKSKSIASGAIAGSIIKKQKPKRAPIKSVAQVQAELAKKAKALQAEASAQQQIVQKKEKSRPGWKGWALEEVDEGAEKKPTMFSDFDTPAILDRSRRRRTAFPLAAPTPKVEPEERAPTPVRPNIEQQSTPVNKEPSYHVPSQGYPPLKGSNWPASGHPSVASTPPSLYSDRETMSDSDETASYKGEYEVPVTSQETTCIPPSFSAEIPVSSEVLSLSQEQEDPARDSSSPLIIHNSLEPAASIDSLESSSTSSQISSSMPQTGVKRSRSQASPLMTTFNQAIVKHASHGPPSAKRIKVEL